MSTSTRRGSKIPIDVGMLTEPRCASPEPGDLDKPESKAEAKTPRLPKQSVPETGKRERVGRVGVFETDEGDLFPAFRFPMAGFG